MLILLLFLLGFPWEYSRIEAKNHLKRIVANGSKQTGMHKFHAQALVWRVVWIFGAGGLACGVYALIFDKFPVLVYGTWLIYAWAVFGYNFTIKLNRLRKKKFPDYNIVDWYVSKMPNAAWSDRRLVKGAKQWNRFLAYLQSKTNRNYYKHTITPEQLAERVYIGFLLFSILLFVSGIIYQAK